MDLIQEDIIRVCPTYVGMNRDAVYSILANSRMPHVCGDEPKGEQALNSLSDEYAPRMWG